MEVMDVVRHCAGDLPPALSVIKAADYDDADLVPGHVAQRIKDERNIARQQLEGAVEALRKIDELLSPHEVPKPRASGLDSDVKKALLVARTAAVATGDGSPRARTRVGARAA